MNTLLNKINKALEEEFEGEMEYKYQIPFQQSSYYEIQVNRIAEHLKSGHAADPVYFLWMLDLFVFHFEYCIYAKLKLEDHAMFKKHLALANEYGYLCLDQGSKNCGRFETGNPFIISNKAAFIMVNLLMAGEFDKFTTIGQRLIASLNGEGCIIKKGYGKATISWFVIKLFSLFSGEEIKLNPLLCPKATAPYEEVLENWNTQDIKEVEKYIDILSEAHISEAHLNYKKQSEEEFNSLSYKELFTASLYSLPFEVITWLTLREKQGLENPKEFSHMLMKQPIAKIFLELETPLSKPEVIPYAKELLTRLEGVTSE